MPVVPGLAWKRLPEAMSRDLFDRALGITDHAKLKDLDFDGLTAVLPFYSAWQIAAINALDSTKAADDEPILPAIYLLWRHGATPMLLDGSSSPVHAANEDEHLHLADDQVADYLRWFCFAVRADTDKPFALFEKAPPKVAPAHRKAAALAEPLTSKGRAANGAESYESTVIFETNAFKATFGVLEDGDTEMLDDEPLMADFPAELTPHLPPLGIAPALEAKLTGLLGASPVPPTIVLGMANVPSAPSGGRVARKPRRKAGKGGKSSRPTLLELVELLLVRAIRAQAQNRLLGYFNATLPAASELDRFAALVGGASPFVAVETTIPFVEETIADIVNERRPASSQMLTCRAHVDTDGNGIEILASFALPNHGPAVVLMPLQVYRRAALVERLAFDIAAADLAAIVTCERFGDLPETLRRYTDVVLHLPDIDPPTFEALFRNVIGKPVPAGWDAGGTDWVKHVLHTDFEHPRRMALSRDEAFAFVRAQVGDRLRSVDPGQGLSLNELHGLGEAREFAEDLIADIHAAMAGKLPWSQVDTGALLVGAPGTGKTTLARAIAKACGIKFIQASAAGWMAEGVSLGPHISAIRKTFAEARNYAPSILFIDEIDSIGSRDKLVGDNNSIYQTEVVNAVLEQIQGMDPAAPVFVLGATNHEDGVDPALRRSGRLDRVIKIPRPNGAALDQIYRYYLGKLGKGIKVSPRLDTLALGRLSVGLTGADVERIVRGAARRARKARRAVSQTDVIDEITDKPRGSTPYVVLTPSEIEHTATHEAGHALALFLSASKGADIGFVTVVPRDDGTLGFVAPLPDERLHLTRQDYDEKLEVFVAGRAAEELVYGKAGISSGASTDLRHATDLAIDMVTQLGLAGEDHLLWSPTASAADLERASQALTASYVSILGKLERNRSKLDALAREIVARQELPGDEVRRILAR